MSHPRANRTVSGLVVAALALTAALAPAAAGAAPEEGVVVVGKGVVRVKPTIAEIDMQVSASAELTGDAIVKFRDAVGRVRDAFAALKLPEVTVEEGGPIVEDKAAVANPYMAMEMGARPKSRTEVKLSRAMIARARGIDAMEEEAVLRLIGRLIDVAGDAGAKVGSGIDPNVAYRYGIQQPSVLVRFVVEDGTKAREDALAAAVADARARAALLARLGGFELGPILAATETAPATANRFVVVEQEPATDDQDDPGHRIVARRLRAVPVRVELTVRFAIPRPEGAKP